MQAVTPLETESPSEKEILHFYYIYFYTQTKRQSQYNSQKNKHYDDFKCILKLLSTQNSGCPGNG